MTIKKHLHYPVMYREVIELIKKKYTTVIDCTFGAGGHSKKLLEFTKVIAIDCDPIAKDLATKIKNPNFSFLYGKFSKQISKALPEFSFDKIVFADLGTSVMQLESNRGFSYIKNSPLKMTLNNQDQPLFAQLNKLQYGEIFKILKTHEVKNPKLIAKNIYNYMLHSDITHSDHLVKATKMQDYKSLSVIFQAFRIYINKEFEELESLLHYLQQKKNDFIILSFHSQEAKIIRKYRGYKNIVEIKPSFEEVSENPNSRSAILHYHYN